MRIAIIGNCQVRGYKLLLSGALPAAEVMICDLSTDKMRNEDNRKVFADAIKDFDVILSQDVGNSYVSMAYLRERFGRKIVSITNFYFRGTFPEYCYVGVAGQRYGFGDYNNAVVLGCFLSGETVDGCLAQMNAEVYRSAGLFSSHERSLEALRIRDKKVDIPGWHLIEEEFRKFYCFRAFNHPTLDFLNIYLNKVMFTVGIRYQSVYKHPSSDPLLFLDLPIQDFLAEHLGLSYRTSQQIKISDRYFSKDEYVRRSYKAYEDAPRESLVINSPLELVEEIKNSGNALLKTAIPKEL